MSSRVRLAEISERPLSVDRLLALVCDRSTGGIAIFVGVVRERDSGSDVVSLDYTQHPTAAAALSGSAERVAEAHDVRAVAVEHRVGHLEVGDLAVVVAAGAVHRGPALAACRALIEDLKQTVPIWKEQHLTSGDVTWVGLP
ncbi:MAG: molybdenum cofactor biosynthesis protein MoaE [Microlunatus sp.]|nr:molybdenum cofactor biosynthesis protein MoaE [Microlunatus sp.]MDN5771288.1 molybdenum cofactor biosynthesis protein MoaE [Microlunatus sp.]MDN5804749.1 molybdenum cofactor biosynthesis protein MoaE [Microlunatus sp.]